MATYSILVIVAVIATLVVKTVVVGGAEPPAEQQRLASMMTPVVQFIVSIATLGLIRNQVSVAVGQIEQAEQSEARRLRLTARNRGQ